MVIIMKRHGIVKLCMALCLVFVILTAPANQGDVQAAEVIATVQGTVMDGTTADILKLSTKEGNMEIKLDGGTDASACKILLPGKKIDVSVSHGSDGYLHAVRISSGMQVIGVTVDSSSSATITGTISTKSKDDVLFVNTPQGEMQIKLDTTTNMSGCSVLVANKTYSIVCARGSDAYMHAISIADSSSVAGSGQGQVPASSLTPAPAGAVAGDTMAVTGTVTKNTKESLLYLSTSGGEMQIVIDSNTDSRGGMVLVPDRKLTLTVYRGSDACMHAATIFGTKDSITAATIDTASVYTVSGTVSNKSTESILFLNTSGGEMQLKLDVVQSVTGAKVLVEGKKLTVTCSRGSDAYMHALTIIGN